VRTGDIVLGDADGVVVVPQQRVDEVVARATQKMAGEARTRDELHAGRLLAEVFARHGIL
jgi:regulator of RNase E activity RraA